MKKRCNVPTFCGDFFLLWKQKKKMKINVTIVQDT